MNRDNFLGGAFLFFMGVILIAVLWAYTPVRAGTVKVVTRIGEVTGRRLSPGLNWITPFIDGTIKYNTKQVTYETSDEHKQKESKADYKDFPVTTTTSDGQQVTISYTIRFSVDPDKAAWVAQNIGSETDLVEKVVKTDSRTYVRNIARKYQAEQLYTGQVQDYQDEVYAVLTDTFGNHGLRLDFVGIREPKFEQEYIDTIEKKQIEKENVITAKNIAERAEHEKQAAITKAEGEAESQRVQQLTITNELLKKWWIEQWNGILPQYMMGDSDVIIDLP